MHLYVYSGINTYIYSFGKDGFFVFFLLFFVFFLFFWFSREKGWFFGSKPPFLENSMVLSNHPSKNHLFSRKRWLYQEKTSKNHLFLEKKMVSNQKKNIFFSRKPKNTSFGGPSPIVLEKIVFLVFLVLFCFFGFLEKKMVFWFETIFSREKDGFEQPSFEKPSFLEKRWFYQETTSKNLFLSREKDGFEPKQPSFSRENQKKHLLAAPAP